MNSATPAPLPSRPTHAGGAANAALGLLVCAGFAAAYVYATRVTSWSLCWRFSITEGREGATIYAIWRILHGAPLYEWPQTEPHSLTYLNYGFYHSYAGVMRLLGADGESLLWLGRVVTSLGSLVGAALFVSTGKLLAPPRGRLDWLALGALGFVVWFGTQFIAWWTLSIRPDVWAAVFALAGLRLALPALAIAAPGRLVLASLFFWLGWSFKQSSILSLVGCALSALFVARSFRALFALAAPFSLLTAACLWLGGGAYRFGIIAVPAASEWRFDLMIEALSRALPQNLWIFGFFPVLVALETARNGPRGWTELSVTIRTLGVVVLVGVALGTLALGREGSNKNHLFEGYVASALASYWALSRIARTETGSRRPLALAIVLLLPLVAFPILQIAAPNRLGRTVLCRDADAVELERFAGIVARLPKPLFTDDEIFSQPWHSSNDRYPAIVVDPTLHGIAKREGFVPRDFPVKLFDTGKIKSVVQLKHHSDVAAVRARGWLCQEVPARPFGLEYVACSVPPTR